MRTKASNAGSATEQRSAQPGVKRSRIKLSTTVAPENFRFLEAMVKEGRSSSIAEAVDIAVARMRRNTNRANLERATAQYFEDLSTAARREEDHLARNLHLAARGIDFDLEP